MPTLTQKVKAARWNVSPGLVAPEWQPLWRGLVLALPFGGPSVVPSDISPSRLGFPSLTGSPSRSAGKFGAAVDIAANTDPTVTLYAYPSTARRLDVDRLTVVFVGSIRSNPEGGDFRVLVRNRSGTGNGYQFIVNDTGQLRLDVDTGPVVNAVSTASYTDGVERVYVGTYDGSTIRVYVDGVQVASASQTGTIGATSTQFDIGGTTTNTTAFDTHDGLLSGVLLYGRALTAREVELLSSDPFGMFRREDEAGVVYALPGGATDLVIQEASHGHTVDNVALTQQHSLTVQETSHSHSVDNVTLTQVHNLTVAETTHSHTVDNVTLTTATDLVIAETAHAHSVDNVTLTQAHSLTVAETSHGHTVDNVALTQVHVLTVADTSHAHTADNVVLTVPGVHTVAPAARTFTVPAEARTYAIPAEDRVYRITP